MITKSHSPAGSIKIRNPLTEIRSILRTLVFLMILLGSSQAAPSYFDFLKKTNPHPVLILDRDWLVFSDQDSKSRSVSLPYFDSDQIQQLTFRKKFSIPDSLRNHTLRINFLGLEGMATIKINNKLIKKHLNLLSSFSTDIPEELLQFSTENLLEISIYHPTQSESPIPELVQVYRSKSPIGILREIYLEFIPPVSISNLDYAFINNVLRYNYDLILHKTAGRTALPSLRADERLFIPGELKPITRTEIRVNQEPEQKVQRELPLPELIGWSPQSPRIYWLEIEITIPGQQINTYRFQLCYKSVQMQAGGIRLDNVPLTIKGISYRENYADTTGKPLNPDKMYSRVFKDLQAIKNLGFNTIRFPINPPHPYCAFLADSLGLFILIENGIWRLPAEYLIGENLMQSSRFLTDEILNTFRQHPSFLALGLGQEIPLHRPEAQRYLSALSDYIDQKTKIFKYVSPLDYERIPETDRIDFYLINKYNQSIFNLLNSVPFLNTLSTSSTPVILGTVGFPVLPLEPDHLKQNENQIGQAQRFFKTYQKHTNLSGFIWESYQDWPSFEPVSIGDEIRPGQWVYPYGLVSWNGEKRDLYQKLPAFMNFEFTEIYETPLNPKSSNFFSFSTFFCSLLFLLFYRRNYRFKENIKRSLAHPYGFFVDLRDRRIISVLNSTVIGVFSNLMVAILLAALCFYYRDNLFFEEIASALTVPFNFKNTYLNLLQNPLRSLLFILSVLYLAQYMVALFLRIINFFTEEKARFRQLVAMCNWAGAPLLLLLPLSMFSYHLLPYSNAPSLIFYLLIIFFLWYNYRLTSGIRVFFMMRTFKVILLVVLIYMIPVSIFIFLAERNYNLIDYLSLLTEAGNLF